MLFVVFEKTGVRIVEFERQIEGGVVTVELWDIGAGVEATDVPAILDEVAGIVYVYDPEAQGVSGELDKLHSTLYGGLAASKSWIQDLSKQIIVICGGKANETPGVAAHAQLPTPLTKSKHYSVAFRAENSAETVAAQTKDWFRAAYLQSKAHAM